MPPDAGKTVRVNATVLIDGAGKVGACEASPKDRADFSQLACNELRIMTFPVRQEKHMPISYVERLSVEFAEGTPPAA